MEREREKGGGSDESGEKGTREGVGLLVFSLRGRDDGRIGDMIATVNATMGSVLI